MSLLSYGASMATSHKSTMDQKSLLEETRGERFANYHRKLITAIEMNDYFMVKLLITRGPAVLNYNEHHQSIFALAISCGNPKIVELLLNQGCDPDTQLKIEHHQDMIPETNPYKYWYKIVELDNVSIFKCLLSCKDKKIDNQQEWSRKILLLACGLGSLRIVEYLLDQGISIESADEQNWTCIFYAVDNWKLPVIRLLVKRGANLKHRDFQKNNLLHVIVKNSKPYERPITDYVLTTSDTFIELFIEKGVDINASDFKGLTPVNAAFTIKNIRGSEIVLLLRQPDIQLNKPDINGTTVLHRIISTGFKFTGRKYLKISEFSTEYINYNFKLFGDVLSKVDVQINVRDKEGRTPLHFINADSLIHLSDMLSSGADTECLKHLKEDLLKNKDFIKILAKYQLMRSMAGLKEDKNIKLLLDQHDEAIWKEEYDEWIPIYSEQIKYMKRTILFDKMTYYDFMHADKRSTFFKDAEIRRVLDRLFDNPFCNISNRVHDLYYVNMLAKNYLYHARLLRRIESDVKHNPEKNLDIVFNGQLPNLVIYNIKKYIDIEDMETVRKAAIKIMVENFRK